MLLIIYAINKIPVTYAYIIYQFLEYKRKKQFFSEIGFARITVCFKT